MDECCGTCNYFCKVKKWPVFDEVLTHICINPFVLSGTDYICEANENDRCECWEEREVSMKYKIDVWQWGSIRESYESDDIKEVADWYKRNWSGAYDCGLCAIEIYEDGEDYPFDEALKLGFY